MKLAHFAGLPSQAKEDQIHKTGNVQMLNVSITEIWSSLNMPRVLAAANLVTQRGSVLAAHDERLGSTVV